MSPVFEIRFTQMYPSKAAKWAFIYQENWMLGQTTPLCSACSPGLIQMGSETSRSYVFVLTSLFYTAFFLWLHRDASMTHAKIFHNRKRMVTIGHILKRNNATWPEFNFFSKQEIYHHLPSSWPCHFLNMSTNFLYGSLQTAGEDKLYEDTLVGLSVRGKNIYSLQQPVIITMNLSSEINVSKTFLRSIF